MKAMTEERIRMKVHHSMMQQQRKCASIKLFLPAYFSHFFHVVFLIDRSIEKVWTSIYSKNIV